MFLAFGLFFEIVSWAEPEYACMCYCCAPFIGCQCVSLFIVFKFIFHFIFNKMLFSSQEPRERINLMVCPIWIQCTSCSQIRDSPLESLTRANSQTIIHSPSLVATKAAKTNLIRSIRIVNRKVRQCIMNILAEIVWKMVQMLGLKIT